MQTFSALAVGTLLGFGFVHLVRRNEVDRQRYWFAAGLLIAAAIYAAFSMNAGPGMWVIVELAGVGLFGGLAVAGYRKSALILAAGWILHVGWDVMHEVSEQIRFVPEWYPALCVSFDVVVGVYLVFAWRRQAASET